MIVTYYNEQELEKAKKVSDTELDELLQEVRDKDSRYYLIERKYVVKNGWFRKPIEKIKYTLLFNIKGCEYQIINFCQDNEYNFNAVVSKSYIHTLLCGWLNGYRMHKDLIFAKLQDVINEDYSDTEKISDIKRIIQPK